MKRPFKLVVADNVSKDTVQCLRELLKEAEAGAVIGCAWVAMHRERTFTTNACGEAHRNPVFASALVGTLWFDLQRQAHGEN